MSNAAYSYAYKQQWNDSIIQLFVNNNREESKEYHLSDKYSVRMTEYTGKVGEYTRYGSECTLVDCTGKTVYTWRSIDRRANFYKIINHSNGNEYLIFRQDLYGYSVLCIANQQAMQFFPKDSLNYSEETFIWTDVDYNSINNTLAVSGCYWAAPSGIHLFTFNNPMDEHQKFIDFIECFDGGYDSYCDDVDFVSWTNGDLHIKRLNHETNLEESIVITQAEYMAWLRDKGKEL